MNFDNADSTACNDNAEARAVAPRASKTIEIRDIPAKSYVQFGKKYDRAPAVGQHATIVPGKSITLHGVYTNRVNGPVTYSKTFGIGETAVYGSYNFDFTGTITSITAKTVTITEEHSRRVHRMDLHDFNTYNWDFDAERSFKRMVEWSD